MHVQHELEGSAKNWARQSLARRAREVKRGSGSAFARPLSHQAVGSFAKGCQSINTDVSRDGINGPISFSKRISQ